MYACLACITCLNVKHFVVACAMKMEACEGGVAISRMRWCRGLPMAERNALCFGQVADSYATVERAPPTASPTAPAVKKEQTPGQYVREAVRADTRSRKPPFAVTDDATVDETSTAAEASTAADIPFAVTDSHPDLA